MIFWVNDLKPMWLLFVTALKSKDFKDLGKEQAQNNTSKVRHQTVLLYTQCCMHRLNSSNVGLILQTENGKSESNENSQRENKIDQKVS